MPQEPTSLLERLRASLSSRYTIEREIGQGGMAHVFLAQDIKHNRQVAIKVLRPDLSASLGTERFLREIEISAGLQHPHIGPLYDSGEVDGLLYYVMPYVEGESLRDRIARQRGLEPEEALLIAQEVAGALDYAHRRGVVHRDIKPANILISDGHAVVADFGIARALSAAGGAGLTQAGMAIGTPSYMSPEQALGETELDGRTDVYALGCVLFEMLVGNPPYEGTTPQAIVAKTISAETPKLERDPLRVQGVIDKAMAKEPSARFTTAHDMRAALRAGDTAPLSAARPRKSLVAVLGIAVVAVVVAVIAFWPRGWSVEGDPRHSLIVFPFENRTADADKDYLEEASMNLLGLAIAHWEDMRVYDDERTGSLMRRRGVESAQDLDFDAAQDMAKEARVGTLVLGDIRREGDSLAIEAKVHDVASGDRLVTEIVRTALDADPRPVFDSLAARILSVSGAPPGERPELLAQTTNSLEAYRAYLAGVAYLQQFNIDSSRAAFEQAVELDSTFALAYIGLRNVDGWAGTETGRLRRESVAKAQAYSASLPPRLRTLVQYYVAYEDADLARARSLAEQLIARDSSDVEAWYQLGEAHFHDRPGRFPRPDTAGNIGTALQAFERTLALNPRYTLAYQHTIDALRNCAADSPWLCMADSAVYGTPTELADRFGAERIEQVRRAARDAQITTAQAWIDAVPQSIRPRLVLLPILIERDRLSEARSQIAALRTAGEVEGARVWNARLLFRQADYAGAADSLSVALDDMPNAIQFFLRDARDGPEPVFSIFAGGGRPARLGEFLEELLVVISGMTDVANGPGGVPLPVPLLAEELRMSLAASFGLDQQAMQRLSFEWLDTVDSIRSMTACWEDVCIRTRDRQS